jgi:hypothetical protein
MFDAAAEIGVAAFMAGDSAPSDEVVVADLERGGIEPWLARRLNVLLPIAFGRRLLDGIEVSDTFVDELGSHRLADDPVYPWLAERAMQASQAEAERIGLRSAEVNAVNQALHAGSRPENLSLGPVALTETLPPPSGGDGGVPSALAAFEGLLDGHGLPVARGRVGAMEIAARVTARPRPAQHLVMAQVDFAVRHPGLATGALMESFAGAGSTWRDAVGEGVAKFERTVLHPFVGGLVDRDACDGHLRWEAWEHPGGAFDVCLGSQLVMVDGAAEVPTLGGVLDRLRTALGGVPLTRAIHSLRVFVAYNQGAVVAKGVLLDGQLWPGAEAALATAPPPGTMGPMDVQQYALLIPA